MKKMTALLLVCLLAFSLAGCGEKEPGEQPNPNPLLPSEEDYFDYLDDYVMPDYDYSEFKIRQNITIDYKCWFPIGWDMDKYHYEIDDTHYIDVTFVDWFTDAAVTPTFSVGIKQLEEAITPDEMKDKQKIAAFETAVADAIDGDYTLVEPARLEKHGEFLFYTVTYTSTPENYDTQATTYVAVTFREDRAYIMTGICETRLYDETRQLQYEMIVSSLEYVD